MLAHNKSKRELDENGETVSLLSNGLDIVKPGREDGGPTSNLLNITYPGLIAA